MGFSKYEASTIAYPEDRSVIVYVADFNDNETARFEYANYHATIYWNNRKILIQPNYKYFTIKDYDIIEDGTVIGKIKKPGWTFMEPWIAIHSDTYIFRRIERGFIKTFIKPDGTYQVALHHPHESIKYCFNKECYFRNENKNQKHRTINGQIELNEKDILVALTGFLLIELMLYDEMG